MQATQNVIVHKRTTTCPTWNSHGTVAFKRFRTHKGDLGRKLSLVFICSYGCFSTIIEVLPAANLKLLLNLNKGSFFILFITRGKLSNIYTSFPHMCIERFASDCTFWLVWKLLTGRYITGRYWGEA